MRLKVKFLKWSSGIPAAMLNKKTAEAIGITDYGRIYVETLTKHPRRLAMAVSTIDKVVKENEIVVSAEIKKRLNLRNGQSININIANLPRSLLFIKKKLDNKKLNRKQIEEIIEDVVKNNLSDPEVSLFISAMYKNGMNFKETTYLIKAIYENAEDFIK